MSRWSVILAVGAILTFTGARAQGPSEGARPASLDSLAAHLREHALPPADYVLSRLAIHRVVLLGEAHWQRHDVELVRSLIPRLAEVKADTLAVEVLPAQEQDLVDRIVTSAEWDAPAAARVMRRAAWPYAEYLGLLRAVWEVNRTREHAPLKLLALGPGDDWRERLPAGQTYETFMARRVEDWLAAAPGRKILVYCGAHHAFTRYLQPEMPVAEKVDRFMERAGNFLWRDLGEDVFLISLHRPWRCRREGQWTYCLPLDGTIDCAAARVGRPVGFDVVGSPFAGLMLDERTWYAMGHPAARLVDLTDGYVWDRPIDEYRGVAVIPLPEYAPDREALAEVLAHNPFSDERDLEAQDLPPLWEAETRKLESFVATRPWAHLADWRGACAGR